MYSRWFSEQAPAAPKLDDVALGAPHGFNKLRGLGELCESQQYRLAIQNLAKPAKDAKALLLAAEFIAVADHDHQAKFVILLRGQGSGAASPFLFLFFFFLPIKSSSPPQ